jgi:putative restriction endonuclease
MKEGQTLWTREECILAINLYCKIPFGQMHASNKDVKDLAVLINRSPAAVARKLGNFASFDPKLRQRGVKGLENASKLDKQIWQEYMEHWDEAFIRGEQLLATKKHSTLEQLNNIDLDNLPQGRERESVVRVRINQMLFRRMVLTNYNNRCCITGLDVPELLVASHILPWSRDHHNRLNPRNGLALNALHDKAFDCGLLTITPDLQIKISERFYKAEQEPSIRNNFIAYDGKPILESQKFSPDGGFLKVRCEGFKG